MSKGLLFFDKQRRERMIKVVFHPFLDLPPEVIEEVYEAAQGPILAYLKGKET